MIGEYYTGPGSESGSYNPASSQRQQQGGQRGQGGQQQGGPPSSGFSKEIYNPTNPVQVPIRGFPQGSRIRVVLQMLDKGAGTFSINLKHGEDILMHFNPRLKEKSVVFNSYYNDSWQYEERPSGTFPFEKKRLSTVEIMASSNNALLVYVDGQFLYEFHQRQQDSATCIDIGGDINIHAVYVS